MISDSEVKRHDSSRSCWVKIGENVYDLTTFLEHHPGGIDPILSVSGGDATDAFTLYHPEYVKGYMKRYEIGTCFEYERSSVSEECPNPSPHVEDFRMLHTFFQRKGLYKTNSMFYIKLCAWLLSLFSSSLYFSLTYHPILGGLLMGLFWQQLAGIGHDLGHSSVFQNSMINNHRMGSFLTSLMGLSLGWWRKDHNTHHVVCNSIDYDPNIQHMPVFAISESILDGFFDQYHKKEINTSYLSNLFLRYQYMYAYPLLILFARWNLYAEGILYLVDQIRNPKGKAYFVSLECIGVLLFFSWMTFLIASQANPLHSFLWLCTSHSVAGLLHVQIVLAHWTMHTYFGKKTVQKEKRNDWYMTQLKTTMNIRTHPLLDWVHLGLQFQIEHHMFPKLPRHNLRLARKYVKDICAKHDLPYVEYGFFEANFKLWSRLKQISKQI